MVKKSFDAPEEIRSFDKSKIEVVVLGDVKAMRVTNQPGWRWSECVKPTVGTDSCQVGHGVGGIFSQYSTSGSRFFLTIPLPCPSREPNPGVFRARNLDSLGFPLTRILTAIESGR